MATTPHPDLHPLSTPGTGSNRSGASQASTPKRRAVFPRPEVRVEVSSRFEGSRRSDHHPGGGERSPAGLGATFRQHPPPLPPALTSHPLFIPFTAQYPRLLLHAALASPGAPTTFPHLWASHRASALPLFLSSPGTPGRPTPDPKARPPLITPRALTRLPAHPFPLNPPLGTSPSRSPSGMGEEGVRGPSGAGSLEELFPRESQSL